MVDGQKVTFSGEGDWAPNIEPGDIIVVLEEKPHSRFKRVQNLNLLVKQSLTLTEALCGFQKVITTLDDRKLLISTVPGEVIKSGDLRCIVGEGKLNFFLFFKRINFLINFSFLFSIHKGMPTYKNPFEKGKMIIEFNVVFPDHLEPTVVAQLEKCLPPRPEEKIPDVIEEVNLSQYEPERLRDRSSERGANYDDDDEYEYQRGAGPGMQCATS